ncbi:MAG TPA: hypothetical protein PK239_06845 [Chitinophagales bacterium]|nr:hypothetical protein [Chitinophagales bacterium]HRK26993.1 hypothetical protein [Chitinophagales bacterium]
MEESKKKSGLFGSIKNLVQKSGEISRNFWGNAFGMGEVVYYLENLTLAHRQCLTLPDAENALLHHLRQQFPHSPIKKQPSNQFNIALTAELEGNIGLICCLAPSLTLPSLVELIGRAHCISHLKYKDQLIVAAIGKPDLENHFLLQEMKKMLENLSVSYCYVSLDS